MCRPRGRSARRRRAARSVRNLRRRGVWRLCAKIFADDPAPAHSRVKTPLLALFGAADKVTPPEESVAALRAQVRPELVEVEVFPEGDHRLCHGEPPRFVDGYLDRTSSFVRAVADRT